MISVLVFCAVGRLEARAADAEPPGEPTTERIVIGIDHAFPPHQWLDEDGEPRGFDVELIRAIAQEIGLDYEFRGGPWSEIRGQLERGEIDLTPGMVRTDERDALLEFSIPTNSVGYSIFVPSDSDEGVRELSGILLRSLGHEVVAADNGESALDLVREKRGFGLLVADLELPGLSGAELARRVLEEFPQMGVLLIGLPVGARPAQRRAHRLPAQALQPRDTRRGPGEPDRTLRRA